MRIQWGVEFIEIVPDSISFQYIFSNANDFIGVEIDYKTTLASHNIITCQSDVVLPVKCPSIGIVLIE